MESAQDKAKVEEEVFDLGNFSGFILLVLVK